MKTVIVTAPLGCLRDFAVRDRRLEAITIENADLARRMWRAPASFGEIAVRLVQGVELHDEDVLFAADDVVVYVRVAAEDVLVALPRTLEEASRLGHLLGNRHLPAHFGEKEIIVRYDPLVEEALNAQGVPFVREARVFDEPFRHAHAPHAH